MRKVAALFALVCCAAMLTGCRSVSEMSTLSELSRPYVGEYVCEKLLLSGEDMLPAFECVRLQLTYGGDAVLSWRTEEGGEGEYLLGYEADPERGMIIFFPPARGAAPRTFPLEKGSVRLGLSLGGRYLYAEFCA